MTAAPARRLVGNLARCSACRARLLWVRTAAGKAMPLDAEPVDDGEWCVEDGVLVQANLFSSGPRYRAHWASCPAADQFRRGR